MIDLGIIARVRRETRKVISNRFECTAVGKWNSDVKVSAISILLERLESI